MCLYVYEYTHAVHNLYLYVEEEVNRLCKQFPAQQRFANVINVGYPLEDIPILNSKMLDYQMQFALFFWVLYLPFIQSLLNCGMGSVVLWQCSI